MLEIQHLTRSFGDLIAVNDVSFQVPEGKMIGFVGGNGAGKTTTMRMIMGLLAPDSGNVYWQGKPITTTTRSNIGYMPEERGLYPKQKIMDQLVYLARLKGSPAAKANHEAIDILTRFGLAERTKDKLEKLSLGNQQRVQIAAAVMANPLAMILDEPFSGLDPTAVDEMAALLRQRTAVGVPVLFSSHQLDLVDRICDGLVILAHGKVVASGSKEEIENRGPIRHRLVVDHDASWVRDIAFQADSGFEVDEIKENSAIVRFSNPAKQHDLLQAALEHGNIIEFARVRTTLSELYREVTA